MQNLAMLDWLEVLERIKNFATSDFGRKAIEKTEAKAKPSDAENCMKEVFFALDVLNQGSRPQMTSIDLYPMWIGRLRKKAVLKTTEIRDVRDFCLETLILNEAFLSIRNSWVDNLKSELMDAGEPLSAIDQILTPNGEIRMDASEKLHNLSREKERLYKEVQNSLDRLVKNQSMESVIQDKYVTTRDGRWVIPVRSGSQHRVPGIIHDSSQTKQTVFIEPETVVPMNNRLRQVEIEIEDEIERLLTELSLYLSNQILSFESSFSILEHCDIRFAQAQFSKLIKANIVEFTDESIDLIEVKHPLLQNTSKAVVANTVLLNQNKAILLLSGPNAGGKTVLLKSVGLAAQMARCGLPICASEASKIPFFDDIMVGIGDAQSVDEELSTFAAHLGILHHASQLKGHQKLILIDEICGSTDPEEGSALARSFIETFSQNQIFAVITSHLGPLKLGWNQDSRVLNGSLEYDSKTGRPTYQFIPGIPGDSLAILTAKRVGVAQNVVDRALMLLAPATRARLEGLEHIEQLKVDISNLQEHLKKETQKAVALKNKYESMLAQFNREKDEWLARTLKKAEKKVDEALQTAKAAQTLDRHRILQDIKYDLPEIVKAKISVDGEVKNATDFGKKFPVGAKVFVPSLNSDALVQTLPNSRGEVSVLSGFMRLSVKWQDLKPPGKPIKTMASSTIKGGGITIPLQSEERVLDLRGKTVEESLQDLELCLDNASQMHEDRIKIIHGHGTEALKKAVRTYLTRSVYVKKWKAGSTETGGDGVTWAQLGE